MPLLELCGGATDGNINTFSVPLSCLASFRGEVILEILKDIDILIPLRESAELGMFTWFVTRLGIPNLCTQPYLVFSVFVLFFEPF